MNPNHNLQIPNRLISPTAQTAGFLAANDRRFSEQTVRSGGGAQAIRLSNGKTTTTTTTTTTTSTNGLIQPVVVNGVKQTGVQNVILAGQQGSQLMKQQTITTSVPQAATLVKPKSMQIVQQGIVGSNLVTPTGTKAVQVISQAPVQTVAMTQSTASGSITRQKTVQVVQTGATIQTAVAQTPKQVQVIQTVPALKTAKSVQVIQQSPISSVQVISSSSNLHSKFVSHEVVQSHQHNAAVSAAVSASNDELLVKELEAYKKKCVHLEQHIQMFTQRLEVMSFTEVKLTETLEENRTLTEQNLQLTTQITLLQRQLEQYSHLLVIESEYQKIQQLYEQQMLYLDQLRSELLIKTTTITELTAKDELNQRKIDELNRRIQEMQNDQDDQVKRSKKDKDNSDKEAQDRIAQLLDQLQEKERELSDLLLVLSNSEQIQGQLDGRIQTLLAQLAVLEGDLRNSQDILDAKNAEIERLRDSCSKFQLTIHQLGNLETDKARLQQALDNRNAEIEQWRSQTSQLNATIADLREQNAKIYALENKIVQLTLEIERLRAMHDYKDEEVKRSRNRQGELEKDADEKRQLQSDLAQLQARMNQLANELKMKDQELNNKQAELQELRFKLNEIYSLQITIQQNEAIIGNLSNKVNGLEGELKNARDSAFNLESENGNLKKQVQEMNYKVITLQSEAGSLQKLTSDYQQVRQSASEREFKVMNLNQEIQNLTIVIQQKEQQIAQQQSQLEFVKKDNEALKQTVNELHMTIHTLQITVHESNNQIDLLKEQQALSADLMTRNELLMNKFQALEIKYNESMRKAALDKESLENKLVMVTMENQRMTYIVQAREQECESLKQQIAQLNEMLLQQSMSIMEVEKLKQEIQHLNIDVETWRSKFHQIEHYEYQYSVLLGKFVVVLAEVESLRSQITTSGGASITESQTQYQYSSQSTPYQYSSQQNYY